MSHINGLVASLVMFSPFEYSTVVTFATHFMGAKAYIIDVFGKSFFALEGFGSIKDHILYYTDIAQFVLATIGRERTTNIVLDSNLEDKVLIEDESIVMNQPRPDRNFDVTKSVIGTKRYIWDPSPISN
ncbi:hypothetical protein KY289_016277 [Solanum tuberosum]|nr:hypothetical protein KY289_016277 [Solanum tuberosum]